MSLIVLMMKESTMMKPMPIDQSMNLSMTMSLKQTRKISLMMHFTSMITLIKCWALTKKILSFLEEAWGLGQQPMLPARGSLAVCFLCPALNQLEQLHKTKLEAY